MKSQKKCRFINLAEQLAEQNEIVCNTMESLLAQVALESDVESRSDFEEIKKTSDSKIPRPKRNVKNSQEQNAFSAD